MSNQAKYDSLREKFEFFCFQGYKYSVENGNFYAKFDFYISSDKEKIEFHPCFEIPARPFYHWDYEASKTIFFGG